jgi:hypothetical protein
MKTPKAKRIAYKKEPILHVHRYIVAIIDGGKTSYWYKRNLKEVKSIRDNAPAGTVIEVYRATHEFIEGWER